MKRTIISIFALLLSGCASTEQNFDNQRFARDMIYCGHANYMVGLGFGVNQITQQAVQNSKRYFGIAIEATNEKFVMEESPKIEKSVQNEFIGSTDSKWKGMDLPAIWESLTSDCLIKLKPYSEYKSIS